MLRVDKRYYVVLKIIRDYVMLKFSSSLIALILISGCSTSVVDPKNIKLVPKERVIIKQVESKNSAPITVVRDTGLTGSGCLASLYLDGNLIAKLKSTEKIVLNVQEGEHILGASIQGEGLCAFNTTRNEREFWIKLGEHKSYRIFIDQNGNVDLKPTTLY